MTRAILLWLFVINLGIAFGAGLYEARVELPNWLVHGPDGVSYHWNAAAARRANTGLRFWVYVTTVPLTLLTLANLLLAWRSPGPIRAWWLSAVALAALDRVLTFSYFIPTMLRLMSESMPDSEAVATALQWARWNHVRHGLSLAAWLTSLKALTLLGR